MHGVRCVRCRIRDVHLYHVAVQLLDDVDGEAGLPGARHADDYAVRRQVAGIEHERLAELLRRRVERLPDIEICHSRPPRVLCAQGTADDPGRET